MESLRQGQARSGIWCTMESLRQGARSDMVHDGLGETKRGTGRKAKRLGDAERDFGADD